MSCHGVAGRPPSHPFSHNNGRASTGAACPGTLDLCGPRTARLPASRWVYYPLSTAQPTQPSAAACCAACRVDADCVFWDHNSTSGECNFYDHSLSQASLVAEGASDFTASVAAARLPLQTGKPESVAGLLDRKTYPGARWGAQADQQETIPGGEDGAAWCAARCSVTCGCRCACLGAIVVCSVRNP